MTSHVGEWAALGAALCWALCAMAFTSAGRRVGSLSVNFSRLVVAQALLLLYGGLVRGRWLPTDATPDAWLWLSLSGVAGFFLCDLCLFESYLLIGPRLGLLILSLNPVITAGMARAFLGESVGPRDWIAIVMAVGGVAWVVRERPKNGVPEEPRHHYPLGVLLAALAAAGQAAGVVLGKKGMGTYDPFAAVQIRMFSALLCFAVLITGLRRWGRVRAAFQDRRALLQLSLGALVGPVLGVVLLFFALQRAPAAIASTLSATAPVLILPLSAFVGRERLSLRAVLGAVLAVAGVALLFL